ncbi:MAG: T9SS type A sorting domain-containing protein, partial [Bacteroidota bacterium]
TLYNKAGASLATTTASTTAFTPSTVAQWRNDTVNLSNYSSNPNVFVRFEAASNYGNNAYIDNVQIISNGTTGIADISKQIQFEVYPNPASDRSAIDFVLDNKENVVLDVVNNLGASVYSRTEDNLGAGEYTFEIPTNGLSSGIYSVIVRTSQGASTRKLVIK